ncbi:uncharacterized protein EV420DRAFT_1504367 [Desarmillaria tabescens]|uniref:DUF6534 domain-containing protein n=1 Tax=Armillaria tabescens TaxID=1929756 RepID=A0AA39NMW0_ARMTA|nr:uncharacterized protein EV420DRAFT_1504367 [Desarmillaria tabescens]KAK0468424.1 hypothetical protein EV420DRAFT_1504367 [Desarmillaria tabescens]
MFSNSTIRSLINNTIVCTNSTPSTSCYYPVGDEDEDISPYTADPGSILVNVVLQAFLIGVIMTQSGRYMYDYKDDTWKQRAFVAFLNILTLLQTILEIVRAWIVFIDGEAWLKHPLLFFMISLINGFIIISCESFFVRRCWKMTDRSPWVVDWLVGYHLYEMSLSLSIAFTCCIIGCLVIDTTVAGIMTMQLLQSKIGVPAADGVVQTVIYVAWESAILPQLSMLAAVIIFHSHARSFISREANRLNILHLFVNTAGKLYVYMLLWTLNYRDELRVRMKSHDLGRVSLSNWQWDQSGSSEDPATTLDRPMSYASSVPSSRLPESIAPDEVIEASGRTITREAYMSTPNLDSHERGFTMPTMRSLSRMTD